MFVKEHTLIHIRIEQLNINLSSLNEFDINVLGMSFTCSYFLFTRSRKLCTPSLNRT